MEFVRCASTMEKVRINSLKKIKEICQYKVISTPVGPITLIANSHALVCLNWGRDLSRIPSLVEIDTRIRENLVLNKTEKQLDEYFSGKRFHFNIPLAPYGTEFQLLAWQQLLKIPYGHRITYGEQAKNLGRPMAARAVGAANGKNPIGIMIPCHRVIGTSGHLTGFAGGLELKQHLLDLEGFYLQKS